MKQILSGSFTIPQTIDYKRLKQQLGAKCVVVLKKLGSSDCNHKASKFHWYTLKLWLVKKTPLKRAIYKLYEKEGTSIKMLKNNIESLMLLYTKQLNSQASNSKPFSTCKVKRRGCQPKNHMSLTDKSQTVSAKKCRRSVRIQNKTHKCIRCASKETDCKSDIWWHHMKSNSLTLNECGYFLNIDKYATRVLRSARKQLEWSKSSTTAADYSKKTNFSKTTIRSEPESLVLTGKTDISEEGTVENTVSGKLKTKLTKYTKNTNPAISEWGGTSVILESDTQTTTQASMIKSKTNPVFSKFKRHTCIPVNSKVETLKANVATTKEWKHKTKGIAIVSKHKTNSSKGVKGEIDTVINLKSSKIDFLVKSDNSITSNNITEGNGRRKEVLLDKKSTNILEPQTYHLDMINTKPVALEINMGKTHFLMSERDMVNTNTGALEENMENDNLVSFEIETGNTNSVTTEMGMNNNNHLCVEKQTGNSNPGLEQDWNSTKPMTLRTKKDDTTELDINYIKPLTARKSIASSHLKRKKPKSGSKRCKKVAPQRKKSGKEAISMTDDAVRDENQVADSDEILQLFDEEIEIALNQEAEACYSSRKPANNQVNKPLTSQAVCVRDQATLPQPNVMLAESSEEHVNMPLTSQAVCVRYQATLPQPNVMLAESSEEHVNMPLTSQAVCVRYQATLPQPNVMLAESSEEHVNMPLTSQARCVRDQATLPQPNVMLAESSDEHVYIPDLVSADMSRKSILDYPPVSQPASYTTSRKQESPDRCVETYAEKLKRMISEWDSNPLAKRAYIESCQFNIQHPSAVFNAMANRSILRYIYCCSQTQNLSLLAKEALSKMSRRQVPEYWCSLLVMVYFSHTTPAQHYAQEPFMDFWHAFIHYITQTFKSFEYMSRLLFRVVAAVESSHHWKIPHLYRLLRTQYNIPSATVAVSLRYMHCRIALEMEIIAHCNANLWDIEDVYSVVRSMDFSQLTVDQVEVVLKFVENLLRKKMDCWEAVRSLVQPRVEVLAHSGEVIAKEAAPLTAAFVEHIKAGVCFRC